MPISSGANGWPNTYRAFQKFKAQKNSPPSPPPAYTETQPHSRPIYHRYPHSSRPSPPRQEPNQPGSYGCFGDSSSGGSGCGGATCGPSCGYNNGCSGCSCWSCRYKSESGPCGSQDGAEPCCCFCGGSALYTTGVAGANAGCFQGGLFSSKNPVYPAGQSNYVLQNQGRHRCCACVTGLILGLLLLGLILGCMLALDPYLKNKSKVSSYLANNPGAYQVGDYIVVPKETYIDYYKVNGAEEPCNPYNNASDYPDPTANIYYPTTAAPARIPHAVANNRRALKQIIITDPPLDILPDCDSLTTNIVWTYSVPITGPTTRAFASARPAATTNVCVLTAGLFGVYIGHCKCG